VSRECERLSGGERKGYLIGFFSCLAEESQNLK
jgi:hypothetical protein